jgi:hypothetical protein
MSHYINYDFSNNLIINDNIKNKNQNQNQNSSMSLKSLPIQSQIFKYNIPINMLIELFDKISIKYDNYYVINNNAYKKGIFNGDVQQFIQNCMQYYYVSKRKYLTCELTYNHFITIIRQICKHLNIRYTSKIKYERSSYDIIYNIYINSKTE